MAKLVSNLGAALKAAAFNHVTNTWETNDGRRGPLVVVNDTAKKVLKSESCKSFRLSHLRAEEGDKRRVFVSNEAESPEQVELRRIREAKGGNL